MDRISELAIEKSFPSVVRKTIRLPEGRGGSFKKNTLPLLSVILEGAAAGAATPSASNRI